MASAEQEHFDLANLHECFQKTGKDGDILIEALLESYHQIYLYELLFCYTLQFILQSSKFLFLDCLDLWVKCLASCLVMSWKK